MVPRLGSALGAALALFFGPVCAVTALAAQTPPAAVKGLAAWYDMSDASSLTLGANSVLQWNDKSGNGETLTAYSTSYTLPIYNAAAIGGLADVAFSGSSTFLTATLSAAPGTNPPHTIFVVGKGSVNLGGAFVAYSAAGGGGQNSVVGPAPYNATSHAWWFGGYSQDASYSGGTNDGAPHVFTKVYSGSAIQGDYDGSSVFTLSQTYNLTDSHIEVGAQTTSGTLRLTGEIGEIIIYNSALTSAQYQYIEGYLACKWGLQSKLPAAHPYKSGCPSGNPLTSGFGGPIAWYDASDATTVVTVNPVSAITDKSGQSNALTQSTAVAQPYLTTVSAQPALVFSGAQQLVTSATNTLNAGANPTTVFAVAAFTGTPTSGYAQFFSYGAATSNQMRGVGKGSGNALVQSQEYFADLNLPTSWSTAPLLAFASFGSTTESLAANGATATTGAHVPSTPASTALHVGSELGGNDWTGPLYEMLVYNATLSVAERQFIEGYLACKWGLQTSLPVAHPYASACPATATANLTLALSVTPAGLQKPGTDLTYVTAFTNGSGTLVYNPVINCAVPANTWFKVGSAAQALGSSGLSPAITYSGDGGTTYAYAPASGAGGATSGYDANVTNIRWTLGGALGPAASVNAGTASYIVGIK